MMSPIEAPFPFLKLPLDVRFMVYDCLDVRWKYIGINLEKFSKDANPNGPEIIIVQESAPVALLATCKQVYFEVSFLRIHFSVTKA